MPSQRLAHPLNRYAAPVEPHFDACAPIAKAIVQGQNQPLLKTVRPVAEFGRLAYESLLVASSRCRESEIIEQLCWRRALAGELRKLHHPSPDKTSKALFIAGVLLDAVPTYFCNSRSILALLAERFPSFITLDHLIEIEICLAHPSSDDKMDDVLANAVTNCRRCVRFLGIAYRFQQTPRMLRDDLKEAFRLAAKRRAAENDND